MDAKKRIKLYALTTCMHCNSIKEMLQTGNFSFESVDVDLLIGKERRDMLEEVRKFNKRCSFPTMVVDDQIIVGYRENEIKEALGI
jgi:glutaredoxin-like protein NrdH